MAVDEDDSLIDALDLADPGAGWNDFAQMVLDNLKTSGVQQAHKEDRIVFVGEAGGSRCIKIHGDNTALDLPSSDQTKSASQASLASVSSTFSRVA